MTDSQLVSNLLQADAKQAFINHFATRRALIENYVRVGIRDKVNPDRVHKLAGYTQDLSATAARYELGNLSETLYFLSTFFKGLGEAHRLSEAQTKELDNLLNQLRDGHQKAKTLPLQTPDAGPSRFVYLVAASDGLIPAALEDELALRGYHLTTIPQPATLPGRIDAQIPDALVIDIGLLPRMGELIPEIKELFRRREVKSPIIFIGRSDNVEHHLLALRAGANAYLPLPAKADYLANKIVSLIQTQNLHFRILIVEDDPAQADYATAILRKAGMEVIALTKPLMAVRVLQDFEPDLILMDLYMPDASGKELTTIIREDDRLLATPIVYLSGEQDTDRKIDALSAGGDDFLTKPIRPHHLINTVTNRIRRSRALRGRLPKEIAGPSLDPSTGMMDQASFIKEVNAVLKSGESNGFESLLHIQLETPHESASLGELPQRELIMAEVANIISDNIHSQDMPARLEGNSFGIFVSRLGSRTGKTLAQLLVALIDTAHYGDPGNPILLKTRIGISELDRDAADAVHLISEAVFEAADTGLSDSNRMADSDIRLAAEILKEQLLQSALDGDELQLDYLPLRARDARGDVSLMQVRIKSPDHRDLYLVHGMLSRIQNESLLSGIDNYCLRNALRHIADNRLEGRETALIVPLSQNMLLHPESVLWLRERLRKMQLVGTGLVLSFRLSDVSQELKNTHSLMKSLRHLGATICFNNFHGSPTHFKIAKALQPEYVAASFPLLEKADNRAVAIVGHNLERLNIKLCLFPQENNPVMSPEWVRIAYIKPAANQGAVRK
ncbi:MAG: response regulator [Gammaproteobacteria bacterium]|nr:response regulator [Gammaproteobacteria bacterium]MBU1654651.1 response regulator [Gammaproteobacteria bacterium]MBU1960444.1 response regulator [Gammaproteobacteria bacterium]